MGSTNSYRYVNTANVYNQGYNAGLAASSSNYSVSLNSYFPKGNLHYVNDGSGTMYAHTWVTLGTPTISKYSNSIITVSIPEEIRVLNRLEASTYSSSVGTAYNRTITVYVNIK